MATPDPLQDLIISLTNHPFNGPDDPRIPTIEEFRRLAKQYGQFLIENFPMSRERSLAVTKLEESVMWGVKSLILKGKDTV